MLIKCPECELQVSNKAVMCPHCGYPLSDKAKALPRKQKRRRKLPNGFGQITELKNRNLRKPFRAMVTVGKTEQGKPIQKLLKPDSYFETYNEAYEALVAYNRNPYDLDDMMTVQELYEKWFDEYSKTLKSDSGRRAVRASWKVCTNVYNMRVSDLRIRHIKGCVDAAPTVNMQGRVKSLFNLMLDYAVEYELIDKNYARSFRLHDQTTQAKKSHIVYTDEEMEKLWAHKGNLFVDMTLIQCYSGWRPKELCLLEVENVDIINGYFIGGMKTEAGTNRTVPVHSKIYPLVKHYYQEAISSNRPLLFGYLKTYNKKPIDVSYDLYIYHFARDVVKPLNLNPDHRLHDARLQFTTMCKNAMVDEYAIKYMLGHSISDITERIYTRRSNEWLKEEIEKIK